MNGLCPDNSPTPLRKRARIVRDFKKIEVYWVVSSRPICTQRSLGRVCQIRPDLRHLTSVNEQDSRSFNRADEEDDLGRAILKWGPKCVPHCDKFILQDIFVSIFYLIWSLHRPNVKEMATSKTHWTHGGQYVLKIHQERNRKLAEKSKKSHFSSLAFIYHQ